MKIQICTFFHFIPFKSQNQFPNYLFSPNFIFHYEIRGFFEQKLIILFLCATFTFALLKPNASQTMNSQILFSLKSLSTRLLDTSMPIWLKGRLFKVCKSTVKFFDHLARIALRSRIRAKRKLTQPKLRPSAFNHSKNPVILLCR